VRLVRTLTAKAHAEIETRKTMGSTILLIEA